jgi:Family of unknown function (DUF6483)
MIRRDYILRMIEEFFQVLSRIRSLKKDQRFQEADGVTDEQLRKVAGIDAKSALQLSETELLARIIQSEPSQAVREKTLLLSTLLKEAGDLATAQDRTEEGRALYLKGLHLLLETLARSEVFECPEFVPKVEAFVAALGGAPLPLPTQAQLMEHYERNGEFGKAEDALYGMLEAEPDHPGIVSFGIAFYERLQSHSDAKLEEGNLPRPELEAALGELRQRRQAAA